MKKKLYFLDEDENNRILNLHESRTKKQYLINEQSIPGVSQDAIDKILDFSAKNKRGFSGSSLFKPQIYEIDKEFGQGTYQKFLDGGGENLLMGKIWTDVVDEELYKNRFTRVESLDKKCEKLNSQPNFNDPIYIELGDWMDEYGMSSAWYTGYLEPILSKIQNLQQYCQISTSLKQRGTPRKGRYKRTIGKFLYDKIYNLKSWVQYFEEPLSGVLKDAKLNSVGTKNSTSKQPEIADTKTPPPPLVASPQKKQWYVLKKTYSDEIKNALNMDSKTSLSDNDIKVIYDKLVQQGAIK